jgi:hypothetical protein
MMVEWCSTAVRSRRRYAGYVAIDIEPHVQSETYSQRLIAQVSRVDDVALCMCRTCLALGFYELPCSPGGADVRFERLTAGLDADKDTDADLATCVEAAHYNQLNEFDHSSESSRDGLRLQYDKMYHSSSI